MFVLVRGITTVNCMIYTAQTCSFWSVVNLVLFAALQHPVRELITNIVRCVLWLARGITTLHCFLLTLFGVSCRDNWEWELRGTRNWFKEKPWHFFWWKTGCWPCRVRITSRAWITSSIFLLDYMIPRRTCLWCLRFVVREMLVGGGGWDARCHMQIGR